MLQVVHHLIQLHELRPLRAHPKVRDWRIRVQIFGFVNLGFHFISVRMHFEDQYFILPDQNFRRLGRYLFAKANYCFN